MSYASLYGLSFCIVLYHNMSSILVDLPSYIILGPTVVILFCLWFSLCCLFVFYFCFIYSWSHCFYLRYMEYNCKLKHSHKMDRVKKRSQVNIVDTVSPQFQLCRFTCSHSPCNCFPNLTFINFYVWFWSGCSSVAFTHDSYILLSNWRKDVDEDVTRL